MRNCVLISLVLIWALVPAAAWSQSPPVYCGEWGGPAEAPGETAFFPWGIAIDGSGNVFVADTWNHRILKLTSSGEYITQWGGSGSGVLLEEPLGIALDASGNVYVADILAGSIKVFTNSGDFLRQWTFVGPGEGQPYHPWSVAVDVNGRVYATDADNNRIQVFDTDGHFLTGWGSWGSGPGQFKMSGDLAVDAGGNVYVSDVFNSRVQKFSGQGVFLTQWSVTFPAAIVVDDGDHVYVGESDYHIQEFTSTGAFLTKWASRGSGPGEIEGVEGIALDASGKIYVSDGANHRLQLFCAGPTTIANTTWGRIKSMFR